MNIHPFFEQLPHLKNSCTCLFDFFFYKKIIIKKKKKKETCPLEVHRRSTCIAFSSVVAYRDSKRFSTNRKKSSASTFCFGSTPLLYMAVKSYLVPGSTNSQIGWRSLWTAHSGVALNLGNKQKSACNWGSKVIVRMVHQTGHDVSKGRQKDLTSLPKPLSVSDILAAPDHGAEVRISFKGVPGSYSEDAALKAYPNCETVPCSDFEAAFKAVELWLADKVIIPIENTSGGSLHRNYDLLLRHRLHIVSEVQLATDFCLLALPGVRAEYLERVLSHPQALDLSDAFLTKLNVAREGVDDTAVAAEYVASNVLYKAGAIASRRAADIYGLNVLAERIQDDPEIISRFLILARDPIISRADKPFKTSIVFSLDEGPGVLFKALAVFALRDINLTKIESRPQRNRPLRVVDDSNTGTAKYFDYLFYIDFEASMAETRAQTALGHLQEFATFIRVLGCYPMDVTI